MEREQAKNPGSRAASYWLAAGLRAQGELDRAWQAAIAALGAGAASPAPARLALRADIDRLVREGIIPDRGREAPEGEREGARDGAARRVGAGQAEVEVTRARGSGLGARG